MMSAWVMSIAGVVFLNVLLDILLPKGQTSKYIKGIFALITVYVIIAPLPSMLKNTDFDSLFAFEEGFNADYAFIAEVEEKSNTALEDKAESMLKREGYDGAQVKIVREGGEIGYVNIDVTGVSIIGDDPNIDILKIKRVTAEYLGVAPEEVRIIGSFG